MINYGNTYSKYLNALYDRSIELSEIAHAKVAEDGDISIVLKYADLCMTSLQAILDEIGELNNEEN